MSQIPVHVSSSAVHGGCMYITYHAGDSCTRVELERLCVFGHYAEYVLFVCISFQRQRPWAGQLLFYFQSTRCWKSGADSCVKLPRCFRGENTKDRPSGTLVYVLAGKEEVTLHCLLPSTLGRQHSHIFTVPRRKSLPNSKSSICFEILLDRQLVIQCCLQEFAA
jgi:hypothetical protein